jgi:hypothetical protein
MHIPFSESPSFNSPIFKGLGAQRMLIYLKEDTMKLELEGTLVKMTPENDREKQELNHLWRTLIDCVNKTRKLVPVGEYIPRIKEIAVFNIED